LASIAIFLVLWEAIWFLVEGIGFYHSWEVAGFLLENVGVPEFWGALVVTILLTVAGLLLGLIVAIIMGLLIGPHHFLEKSSRGSLYFARAIPSVALIPLLMAALGSRLGLVVILVTWLVSIKLVLFVIRGVRDLDSRLEDQAAVLQIPALPRALFLRIPAASAQIMTGLRLTVNRAYGAVVLGGLLAGTPGIGRLIQLARLNGDSLSVLGYAFVAGMIGVLFFWAFGKLEEVFVRWRAVS
jgi:ABC-type nitrate/sulfonate/bicarbonate transport system permease component